jgi:hypothetical protein
MLWLLLLLLPYCLLLPRLFPGPKCVPGTRRVVHDFAWQPSLTAAEPREPLTQTGGFYGRCTVEVPAMNRRTLPAYRPSPVLSRTRVRLIAI